MPRWLILTQDQGKENSYTVKAVPNTVEAYNVTDAAVAVAEQFHDLGKFLLAKLYEEAVFDTKEY